MLFQVCKNYFRFGLVTALHHAVKWKSFTKASEQVYNQMFYNLRNFLN